MSDMVEGNRAEICGITAAVGSEFAVFPW